jgi:outer membrane protein OmpA-like peptidoglycan-associated protein
MGIVAAFASALVFALGASAALAEPTETEIPNVTAEVVELRTSGGVTRLAIRYTNAGATQVETKRFAVGAIVLVDVKSKKKYFPIKAADGMFVGGPIGDTTLDGGRIIVTLPAGQPAVLWTYFEALPAGTVVSVELPQMFPFEDVVVTEGATALTSPTSAMSTPAMVVATLIAAKRADAALKVRLKLAAEPGVAVDMRDPYFRYKDVYLFDSVNKRKYPLLKDSEGIFQAMPLEQQMHGGTFIPKWNAPILMSLTFQAPPDDVTSVDLILPDFLPMEGVAIAGIGGAATGGIAAAGKSLGLEGALTELKAQVTPQEIKIDLSADVLFDFDKAELKPAAEQQLNHLLTVVKSKPSAAVAIEGHTDVRGDAAYNQELSQRRAEAVRAWLVAHGAAGDRLTASGAGEARPVRTGDTESDHQANRRVEIRIRN